MGDHLGEKIEGSASMGNGFRREEIKERRRVSNSSSDFLVSESMGQEESHSSSEDSSAASSLSWTTHKAHKPHFSAEDEGKTTYLTEENPGKQGSAISEIEIMMKERLSKLLLGEDMSGCGNGVCTALAISNSITNLCATLFGQLWRLEPVPPEKKAMWRREMEWLLCVSDHIVELVPSLQTFSDASELEIMTCRPRSDLYVNLPALRKLDHMLLEILDSFENTEFWYIDQGILAMEIDRSSSFRQSLQRQEEKWWLPVPQVPQGGLSEDSRKSLQNRRDCTNQIFKAATSINTITLGDMEVPESYLEALPKNARACLGDIIYRYVTSDQFYPECLLDCLDLSSEHQAIEISNRVEASIYIWRKKVGSKMINNTSKSNSKSSWDMVKELIIDTDKQELLADRAESLLHCLKQRFPGLPQTTLDMSKIQFNKDVGKSILESYSRVLESLAFNIVARIDDLLYVDELIQHSDESSSNSDSSSFIAHKSAPVPSLVPTSSTPYRTAFATPTFSPAHMFTSGKTPQRRSGIKKVLNSYISIDTKGEELDSSQNCVLE